MKDSKRLFLLFNYTALLSCPNAFAVVLTRILTNHQKNLLFIPLFNLYVHSAVSSAALRCDRTSFAGG